MGPLIKRGKLKQTANEASVSIAKSQLVLFRSRNKFALLYCLATVTGLFCLPGVIDEWSLRDPNILRIVQMTLSLPLATLLVTAGTYIMNDLVDADLDRANGKKRPIPSGQVSKQQARIFVTLAFGSAVILTVATLNPISIVIVMLMLTIGITYSLPRVALMKRFLIKTVSIAVFYMLCALFGLTSTYNFDLAMQSPVLVASVLLTLALMVFISSILNDMGDVDGDERAGRRTIPIVIGKQNTIKLTKVLTFSILAITWIFFTAALTTGQGSSFSVMTTTAIAMLLLKNLGEIEQFQNAETLRLRHKKLFPLQMALHPSLISVVIII